MISITVRHQANAAADQASDRPLHKSQQLLASHQLTSGWSSNVMLNYCANEHENIDPKSSPATIKHTRSISLIINPKFNQQPQNSTPEFVRQPMSSSFTRDRSLSRRGKVHERKPPNIKPTADASLEKGPPPPPVALSEAPSNTNVDHRPINSSQLLQAGAWLRQLSDSFTRYRRRTI